MRLSMVMAMDRNQLIGKDDALPWHLPAELAYFKSVTMGKVLIMGRKTYASIGKPLPGRISVVVSSSGVLDTAENADYIADGKLYLCSSLDDAIAQARLLIERREENSSAVQLTHDEAAIIGGAQLCEAAMAMTDRLYLTVIDAEFDGDTWLKSFREQDWNEISVNNVSIDDYDIAYRVLERVV